MIFFCRFLLVLFGSVPVKTMICFLSCLLFWAELFFMQERNIVQTESNKSLLLMETLPARVEVFLGFRIYFFCPWFPTFISEIIIIELQLALLLCISNLINIIGIIEPAHYNQCWVVVGWLRIKYWRRYYETQSVKTIPFSMFFVCFFWIIKNTSCWKWKARFEMTAVRISVLSVDTAEKTLLYSSRCKESPQQGFIYYFAFIELTILDQVITAHSRN